MILYEYEGKELLKEGGVAVPAGALLDSPDAAVFLKGSLVLKAQVLSGKRKEAGGIVFINDAKRAAAALRKLFGKKINGETVQRVLLEEKVEYDGAELYVSFSYDGALRSPILTVSKSGGTGVESRRVEIFTLNILKPVLPKTAVAEEVLAKLARIFFDNDCLLLEINPLVKKGTQWFALDAKLKLDDNAFSRHKNFSFPPRGAPGHTPTEREVAAKKIDEADYRGTAGSAYFDFDGDIAVLASGGGASLTAMDALLKAGGRPANYTEYSGNPPREKVERLTEIVLSHPKLSALWVVGAVANFTNVYETLSGFLAGLRNVEKKLRQKFDFPIVIRRGGPKDKEAFAMLREATDFDFHLYGEETTISQSAQSVVRLAREYKKKGSHDSK